MLALGSKEIAATLPLVVVVAEYVFFRDADKTWPGIHPAILLFALIASAGVVVLYLGTEPAATIAAQYAGRDLTPTERMLTELRVIVFYSSLLLFPYPGRLNLDHAFSVSHSLMDPISTLAAALILLALAFTGLALVRRQPILSFSILWFLITLSIESSFIGLDLVFEHRLYLPMFGFALALGYLFSMVPRRRLAPATTLAGLIVVVLALGTIVRNETWQDPAALWADAAAKNPSSYRAHNNLGRVLVARGQAEQAALQFSEAIRLKPDYAEAYNNLGTVHAQTGRLELAQVNFAKAIELNPRYAQAYNNLGVALLSEGRALDAARQLVTAIRLEPRYAKAHANLSDALARLGQVAAACRHLLTAIELDAAVPRPKGTALTCHADTKSN